MKYKISDYEYLKEEVDKLKVEELIEVVCCPNVVGDSLEYYPNCVCTFIHPTLKEKAIGYIERLDKVKKRRQLIVSDLEAGPGSAVVGATLFPSLRAVKETGNEDYAYKMGVVAAKEANEAGYQWTFGPCADILMNHFSPITSIRSCGDDYKDVIKYAGGYLRGLQDSGMFATLKHFPGDGLSEFDQHLTTAKNPLSKEEWDNSFRLVYSELINQGAVSIMPGHISLSCYDELDEDTGIYPPATLSYNLLTKLLKEDLGFEGLIISDATEMGGFTSYINYYDACVRFLNSGGDMLLFCKPNSEFISEIKKRIDDGKLSVDVLRNRAYRCMCFVEDYYNRDFFDNDNFNHDELAYNVVRDSVKVFKDKKNTLPIKKGSKIAHVVICKQYNMNAVEDLNNELAKVSDVTEFIDVGPNKLREIAKSREFDYIVCSIGNMQWYGTNQIILSGVVARNMMGGWMKYDTPVIFVDMGNPYIHEEYEVAIDTLIYTYGYNKYTAKEVINKIFENKK